MKFNKIALAAVSACSLFGASGSMAAALNDFNVNPVAYVDPLAVPLLRIGPFTADKITGNYQEIVTFDDVGNFYVSLKWQAGQFVGNDGATPVGKTGLNLGDGAGYGLYALLQGAGTVATNPSGVSTFTLTSGGINVWIDDGENTTFNAPANGAGGFTAVNVSDDVKIASGSILTGTGTLDPTLPTCANSNTTAINCGSFGQTTTFALEAPAGTNFFTSPAPFYNLSFQAGQLNSFAVEGTQSINGSLDVVFAQPVPEPGSLALVSLALLGLSAARRRKA